MPGPISGSGVDLTSAQTVGGVKTFTAQPIVTLANPGITLTDTAGTGGTGNLSLTYGLNAGHVVAGFGPNAALAFAGPTAINGSYDFSMLIQESNWITGGKVQDEMYWTTGGNKRVLFGFRNVTDGYAGFTVNGGMQIDGTQTGMRNNSASNAALSILDNSAGIASITVLNTNSTSKAAQIQLGGAYVDSTGWAITEDQPQTGTHKLSICDKATFTFPFWIDSSGRIAIGHSYSDSIVAALDITGTTRTDKASVGGATLPSGNALLSVGPADAQTGSATPSGTTIFAAGPNSGSRNDVVRLAAYNNADYDLHFSTDYSSSTVGYIGLRNNGTDADIITLKGTGASGIFVAGGAATSCTGATIGSGSKANAGFITATTTGTSTIVITFPYTAATAWNVMATNLTTGVAILQTASTTTTATLVGTTVSGGVIRYIAFPY